VDSGVDFGSDTGRGLTRGGAAGFFGSRATGLTGGAAGFFGGGVADLTDGATGLME